MQFTEDDGVHLLVQDDDDAHEDGDGEAQNLGGMVVGQEADQIHREKQCELKGEKVRAGSGGAHRAGGGDTAENDEVEGPQFVVVSRRKNEERKRTPGEAGQTGRHRPDQPPAHRGVAGPASQIDHGDHHGRHGRRTDKGGPGDHPRHRYRVAEYDHQERGHDRRGRGGASGGTVDLVLAGQKDVVAEENRLATHSQSFGFSAGQLDRRSARFWGLSRELCGAGGRNPPISRSRSTRAGGRVPAPGLCGFRTESTRLVNGLLCIRKSL